jgi:hypothetical protein
MTGGVHLNVSPTLMAPDQSQQALNWSLEEPGALIMRQGHQRFSTASLGAGRMQGGQRVYLSSHTFTLVAHNSTVYLVSDAGVFSTAVSGFSTRQIFFPYDRDMVVVLDGVNRPRKSTDGVAWSNFGITAPATCVTASTLSSGVCSSGEYEFAFSFKDRSLSYESNISTGSTVTLTGSSGAFHLTAGSSLGNDAQVDAFVWYGRDVSAGETVFRKISSGTASTFRVTDTNWTANDEAPTNHDVLSKASFARVWKNRWWFVDPDVTNRLRFSELFLPQAVPELFYIDIPFERGDGIAAIEALGDVLVVWGQSRPFLIIGQTSLDFEVRPSAGGIAGALGPRATALVEQGIVHASAEGVHIFDGATDKLLTHPIEPAYRDAITHTDGAELQKTPVVYESRRKCVRVALPRIYPYAEPGEWELNLDRTRQSKGGEAWVPTDRTIGGYIHYDGNEPTAGNRGELITWSDTVGILFKESTGTSANSSAMTATYKGPGLALGLHRANVIDLHVEYEPHGGALTCETLVDGISQGARNIAIGTGIAAWGSGVWGTFLWGGSGRRKGYQMLPLGAEGRTVEQIFTYSGTERMRLYTYAVTVLPETKPSELTE